GLIPFDNAGDFAGVGAAGDVGVGERLLGVDGAGDVLAHDRGQLIRAIIVVSCGIAIGVAHRLDLAGQRAVREVVARGDAGSAADVYKLRVAAVGGERVGAAITLGPGAGCVVEPQ